MLMLMLPSLPLPTRNHKTWEEGLVAAAAVVAAAAEWNGGEAACGL